MLAHFEKLSTPIKSVTTYPTIPQQYSRFKNRGWSSIQAQSLWSAWSDESFLTSDDRLNLDRIEPFDEHEEFALFASHYLLLRARNHGGEDKSAPAASLASQIPSFDVETAHVRLTGQHTLRRNAGAMTVPDVFGNSSIINCFGLGNNNRLSSYDVHSRGGLHSDLNIQPKGGPSGRVCFQLTDLGNRGVLLTGGRSSPAKAMSDCWLFKRDSLAWERTFDLPVPLYRHSACKLTGSSLVLVLGGRSGATGASDLVFVYNPEKGWLQCNTQGPTRHKFAFGATLICTSREAGLQPVFNGFLAGGLSSDGVVDKRVLAWNLSFNHDQVSSPTRMTRHSPRGYAEISCKVPTINFSRAIVRGNETARLLSRFGGMSIQDRDSLIVLGGVGCDGTISRENDIAVFSTYGSEIQAVTRMTIPSSQAPRPLLVGSSVALTDDREIVIIGGAATCFSMGTFCRSEFLRPLRLLLFAVAFQPISSNS